MINKRSIIFSALVFLVNISAVLICFYLYIEIKKEKISLYEIVKESMVLEKEAQANKLLASQIPEIKESEQKIDLIFLKKEEIISFIETLENLGKKTSVSVKLSSVRVGEGKEEKPSLSLELEGEFKQIFNYLLLMENLPYQIIIDDLDLRAGGISEEKKFWSARVGIKVASFINNEEIK